MGKPTGFMEFQRVSEASARRTGGRIITNSCCT